MPTAPTTARRFTGLTYAKKNAQGYDEYTLDKDPTVVLIRIPGGTFTMGSTASDADDDEKPLTKVTLSGYFLAKHETTQGQYGRFCKATSRTLPEAPSWASNREPDSNQQTQDPLVRHDAHPVVNVSFEDAKAYCAWAGLALPTEAQWEYAARGPQGREWPWGDVSPETDRQRANIGGNGSPGYGDGRDGFIGTAPVGSFPRGVGPFGTLDQVGNVWEWCADWYGTYPGGQVTNPTGPDTGPNPTAPDRGPNRVLRGGCWINTAGDLRGANRYRRLPSLRLVLVGFRPALIAPPEASSSTRSSKSSG